MPKSKKTYSIIAVTNTTDGTGPISVDVQEGIGSEELTARLANKPEHVDYHVFSGDEIPWQSRTVIEVGAPKTSRPRAKAAAVPADPNKAKRGRPKKIPNGEVKSEPVGS